MLHQTRTPSHNFRYQQLYKVATEDQLPLPSLTVELLQAVLLITLILAVYATHLDIHSQTLRLHRRIHILKTQRGGITRQRNSHFKPNLSVINELPSSTSTFRPTEHTTLLLSNTHPSSCINLSDLENLPPPSPNL